MFETDVIYYIILWYYHYLVLFFSYRQKKPQLINCSSNDWSCSRLKLSHQIVKTCTFPDWRQQAANCGEVCLGPPLTLGRVVCGGNFSSEWTVPSSCEQQSYFIFVAFSSQSSWMAAHLPLKELTSRLLAASRPGGDGEMYGTRCERPMSVFYAPNQRADRLWGLCSISVLLPPNGSSALANLMWK